MVSFIVRMRFDLADHDQVREYMHPLTLSSREEPGCITYIAHFVEDDPSTLVIYEQYIDQAALDFHRATPHFKLYATNGFIPLVKERNFEFLSEIC